ncbi:MAG: response regulator [Parvibaculales bacterium]
MSLPDENTAHILIVDDDRRIRSLLQKFLSENGYRTSIAGDAKEARQHLEALEFDLIVLDVMMPGETGMELTKDLRTKANAVPILLLTALADVDHRIEGLQTGADDYLPKPFDPQELLLRINNILRRQAAMPSSKIEAPEEVTFGDCIFKLERGELLRGDERISLTTRDIELLRYFAEKAGQIIPREALMQGQENISERAIDVQINRLRQKIEDDPRNPVHLQTVRGAGYILRVD